MSGSYSFPLCFYNLITKRAGRLSSSVLGISSLFLFSLIHFVQLLKLFKELVILFTVF